MFDLEDLSRIASSEARISATNTVGKLSRYLEGKGAICKYISIGGAAIASGHWLLRSKSLSSRSIARLKYLSH
ncbi:MULTISPECIES: hypothetical protein [unclassified Chamaesiphon]|uniref:hypothetical protein n=1 Tax=unclassified Chamaesiphon TaxID=2620921 RepID=UPI00286CA29D|nr:MULTISPECIES: hypothetical protein [unclassified Chamaesiphon]